MVHLPRKIRSVLPACLAILSLAVAAAVAENIDLTGLWRDENGAHYRVRQLGNRLIWSMDSGAAFGGTAAYNVFEGVIYRGTVNGEWVDLPGGQAQLTGKLGLKIESNDKLVKIWSSADYGASFWKREAGSAQSAPQAAPKPAPKPAPETKAGAPEKPAEEITWDFETGDLRGWTKTGTAFDNQPTYGDNPTARGRGQPSNHKGDYWLGTWENRHTPGDKPGGGAGDGPMGTLTSEPFTIEHPVITFLIGGGCDLKTEHADLLIDGKAVLQATGKCSETMERVRWDVKDFMGRTAQLRIADETPGGWGHINLDDVAFEDR